MRDETKQRFTPGPWTCHSGMVWKDGPDVYPKGDKDGVPIATMCREPNNGTLPVERDANARLIAAAPELLAALKGILDVLPRDKVHPVGYTDGKQDKANDAARAAIQKAEGGQ